MTRAPAEIPIAKAESVAGEVGEGSLLLVPNIRFEKPGLDGTCKYIGC